MQRFFATRSLLYSILLPLLGFLVVLVSLNLYSYYRIKGDLADVIIAETGAMELNELRAFLDNTANRLNMARDWGRNSVFQPDDTVALNRKLFPFMQSGNPPAGLLLADSTGWEYFLYRTDEGLVTRLSRVGPAGTSQTWQVWATPERKVKQWRKETDYDPRTRPWFTAPGEPVSWTSPYVFYESRSQGITASVSWIVPGEPDRYMVFGLDLLLDDIRRFLDHLQVNRQVILFLIDPTAGYTISSSRDGLAETADRFDQSQRRKIIDLAAATWQRGENPTDQTVSFRYNGKKWLARFQQLGTRSTPVWLGVAGSERELAASLKDVLFRVDLADVLAAVGGGLLLLFLLRRLQRNAPRAESSAAPSLEPAELIRQGEGAHLEFKSSVRCNLKTGKAGKEIELAWLKAVVAFLNSGGGVLLLGVADDGTVPGLDHDNFENDDRCLLHVKNLLNQHVGAVFSPLIDLDLLEHAGKRIVRITCRPSAEPVFLRVGKNEEFFIRSGPANTKLSPSQIISYLEQQRDREERAA